MYQYITPVIFSLIAFVLFMGAKSAIHEIEAAITLLIATVMFCTNRVCTLLEALKPAVVSHPVNTEKPRDIGSPPTGAKVNWVNVPDENS